MSQIRPLSAVSDLQEALETLLDDAQNAGLEPDQIETIAHDCVTSWLDKTDREI